MFRLRYFAICLLLAAVAVPATAYTVYLKDGTRFIARERVRIDGDRAIILLQSGTRTSLAASEIDFERTDQANQNNLGTALVLDNGQFTDTPQGVVVQKRRLADIARSEKSLRRPGDEAAPAPATPQPEAPSQKIDHWNPERNRYGNLEVAEQIVGVFRAHGIDSVQVLEGSAGDRALLDITTDSEGSVFRALEAAATALVEARESYADTVGAFEVLMTTSNRARAGRFVLMPEMAADIAARRVEPSAFFVQRVQF